MKYAWWTLAIAGVAVWYYGVMIFLGEELRGPKDDEGRAASVRLWPLTLLLAGIAWPIGNVVVWWNMRAFRKRLGQ